MINRKILFMTIFSLAAHVAVAAVIVYAPYVKARNSIADHSDKVIWGYVDESEQSAGNDMVAPTDEPVNQKSELIALSQMMPEKDPEAMMKQVQHKVQDERRDDITLPFKRRDRVGMGYEDTPPLPPLEKVGAVAEISLAKEESGETGKASFQSAITVDSEIHSCSKTDDCGTDSITNDFTGRNSYDISALTEFLKREIEKFKYYPESAKSRGLEGTVYINFHIGQDGTTDSISVARSSGSRILDDAGVKTIRMVGKLSHLHKELRELDIVVPITYKLEK